MPLEPLTQDWPDERAILFVHGVGNAKPGDYDPLINIVKNALGPDSGQFAFYALYYDVINNWFAEKTQLKDNINKLKSRLSIDAGGDKAGEIFADFAGDVLWPVLYKSARLAIREHYLAQVKQMVLDGMNMGVPAYDQKLSIICHSLGCFHTYEALHAMADEPQHILTPATDGVTFQNVIYMASPVQLIKAAAGKIHKLFPDGPACLKPGELFCPSENGVNGNVFSTNNWISITGNMDPVGGFLFKTRQDWAYMDVNQPDGFTGQQSIIDDQDILAINSVDKWIEILKNSLQLNQVPEIPVNNPHSWEGYVLRHKEDLKQWLIA